MVRWCGLILFWALLAGCFPSSIRPERATVVSFKKIAVLPLQPPQFYVSLSAEEQLLLSRQTQLKIRPEGTNTAGARFVDTVAFITNLVNLRLGRPLPSEGGYGVLAKDGTEQCRQMAKAAVAALQEVGLSAVASDSCYNLPATNRAENERLGPIRQWYDQQVSDHDYARLGYADSDTIMEVGLLENAYFDKHLSITVGVKIIEAATGRVVGRARSFQHPRFDMESLLTGGSLEDFTRVAVDAEAVGVRKCLEEMWVEHTGGKEKN